VSFSFRLSDITLPRCTNLFPNKGSAVQETTDVTLEFAPDLECGLSVSEIAEVFIHVLGGANAAEDVIGLLLFDCCADNRGYWTEVITVLRSLKCELELSSATTLH